MTGPEIDAAKATRWDAGLRHYRQPGQAFVGDPIRELREELVDALNYVDVATHEADTLRDAELLAVLRSVAHHTREALRLL